MVIEFIFSASYAKFPPPTSLLQSPVYVYGFSIRRRERGGVTLALARSFRSLRTVGKDEATTLRLYIRLLLR